MREVRAWEIAGELWLIEFPDEQAARRAREEYARLVEADGQAEADTWAEDIIARHGGRLV